MSRLAALVAAFLLHAAQPLGLATLSTASLFAAQTRAKAQNLEAVQRIAETVTVRIEGATQGSGVIIDQKDYNDKWEKLEPGVWQYKILTAWHVLKSNRPGEEIYLYMPDGKRVRIGTSNYKQIRDLDMAIITFLSRSQYRKAEYGPEELKKGSPLLVAGYPLRSPGSLFVSRGALYAKATFSLGGGYQILYTNRTSAGMSGGPVLSQFGKLYGIHGQGERDAIESEKSSSLVKTGINLGIPAFYRYLEDESFPYQGDKNSKPMLPDDFLLMAEMQKRKDHREVEKIDGIYTSGIKFAEQWNDTFTHQYAYFHRANYRREIGKIRESIDDSNMVFSIAPNSVIGALSLGIAGEGYARLGDFDSAYSTYLRMRTLVSRAPSLEQSQFFAAAQLEGLQQELLAILGLVATMKDDHEIAVKWFTQALEQNPSSVLAARNMGPSLLRLGRTNDALSAFRNYDRIKPHEANTKFQIAKILHEQEKHEEAIIYLSKALEINPGLDQALSYRAFSNQMLKRYKESIRDYTILINRIKGNQEASLLYSLLAMRGFAYQGLNNWEDACNDYRQALSLGNMTVKEHASYCNSKGF